MKGNWSTVVHTILTFSVLLVIYDPFGLGLIGVRYRVIVVGGSLLLCGMLMRGGGSRLPIDKKFFLFVLLLFSWMVVSALVSKNPIKSLAIITGLGFVFTSGSFGVQSWFDPYRYLHDTAKVFIFFGMAISVVATLGLNYSGRGYLASDYVEGNPASYVLVSFLGLLVALLFLKTAVYRFLSGFGILGCIALLLVNGSKGIVLVAAIYVLLIVFCFSKRLSFAGVALLAIGLGALIISPTLNQKFQEFAPMYKRGHYMEFTTGRLDRFQYQLDVFELNPVFGVGFSQAEDRIQGPSASSVNRAGSHNSYLTFLSETGLVGGLLFGIVTIYVSTKLLVYLARVRRIDRANWHLVFWSIFLLGLIVTSTFEGTLSGLGKGGTLFWFISPVLLLVINRSTRRERSFQRI